VPGSALRLARPKAGPSGSSARRPRRPSVSRPGSSPRTGRSRSPGRRTSSRSRPPTPAGSTFPDGVLAARRRRVRCSETWVGYSRSLRYRAASARPGTRNRTVCRSPVPRVVENRPTASRLSVGRIETVLVESTETYSQSALARDYPMSDKPHQNLAIIGHVDHGKEYARGSPPPLRDGERPRARNQHHRGSRREGQRRLRVRLRDGQPRRGARAWRHDRHRPPGVRHGQLLLHHRRLPGPP